VRFIASPIQATDLHGFSRIENLNKEIRVNL